MKNILFPTDFSETAQNAFVYALHLAKSLNANLHVLHTFEIPIVTSLSAENPQVVQQVFQNVELTHFEEYKDEAAKLRIIADDLNLGDVNLSFLFQEGDLIFNILEAIKKAQDELTTTFYEVSSKVYQAEAEQAAQQEGGAEQGAEAGQDEGPTGDNVVDADFEVEEDN